MSWDANTITTSSPLRDVTVGISPMSHGYVNQHPVHFTEGNVANLGAATPVPISTPLAADIIPALPSFLGAALTSWGLSGTVGSTANAEMYGDSSTSIPNGTGPLPEFMQRSLRAAWSKVKWRELHKLRHGHYYTGEVAALPSDLQNSANKVKQEEEISMPCKVSDASKSIEMTPTILHEHTAVLLTDTSHKQGSTSLCTQILPQAGGKNSEKGKPLQISSRSTCGRQPHGYGVLLYIIYGHRRNITGSTLATPTKAATGYNGANDDASDEHLIPLALVPKAYCPVADLFDRSALDTSLDNMSDNPKSVKKIEKSVQLESTKGGRGHNNRIAILSLVIYKGGFWHGHPHGKGRLMVFKRYILEGEWVYGAPQLKSVCVLRKICAHQINLYRKDLHGRSLDHLTSDKEKDENYLHATNEIKDSNSSQNSIIFSEEYMGTLAVGINQTKALSPEEVARFSEPWKRADGLSWAINPRISLLYNGYGEALSTPSGNTQSLLKSKVGFVSHESSSNHENCLAMERKGIVWYCGEWVAGKRHGVGAEWCSTGPNRGLYLGDYEHNQRHGLGILEYDNGNSSFPSLDRGSDFASVFSGSWRCNVRQPTATLLLNSSPFMSLQGAHWRLTPDHPASGEKFLFDQALFMKGQHSLSCLWEPIFRKLDMALGMLPPLDDQLNTHLPYITTEISKGDDKEKRLYEYIRPILEIVISLKEWEATLSTFQRLFYFIFGKCPGSKMWDGRKYRQQHPKGYKKSDPDTTHSLHSFYSKKSEDSFQETDTTTFETDTLLGRLEKLGHSTPFDIHSLNTRHYGSRPTPYFLYNSPSYCQLMGLSTLNEATSSSHQCFFDTQEILACTTNQADSVARQATQFTDKTSEYSTHQVLGVHCLHAYSTNPSYTSISTIRGQTASATAERAFHYAASFITSIQLRLIPFVTLHPLICEEINHHKLLEKFGWNVVYGIVGPLLYDLCNAVVTQQPIDCVGSYLHTPKDLDGHNLIHTARQSLGSEQGFSFSSATQHYTRLGDLHAAVSRLLQETNISWDIITKQMDLEFDRIANTKYNSDANLKNVGIASSFCAVDSVKREEIKVLEDQTPCTVHKVALDLEEIELIHRAACIFSNPALFLEVESQHTSCGALFIWHPSSQTYQQTILGFRSSDCEPFNSPATLSDILDTLTALVHLSVVKFPNELLYQQRWLGKCVLLAACKAEEMLMEFMKQETYTPPFHEEALRSVGFSPFACILLACLTTLGWISPKFPFSRVSHILLYDLGNQHHHNSFNEEEVKKSEYLSSTTMEASIADVLRIVFNASCRLVHCYPFLLRHVHCRNDIDDDIWVYPLDELYVRAQYCASLCGSERMLKKLLTVKKQQHESSVEILNELPKGVHAVFPSFTCFNHPFLSCKLNESTLSTAPSTNDCSFDLPLKIAETTYSGMDELHDLKNLLKKTLRLPKETMVNHLEQYWSEISTEQTLLTGTGNTKTEEKESEDYRLQLNLFKNKIHTPMRQETPQVDLSCTQTICSPATQLHAYIPNRGHASLSDLVAWVFKCVSDLLQGSRSDISPCDNISSNTNSSELGKKNCFDRDVYAWKHFVYGFQQHKQASSARYRTFPSCESMSRQSLPRSGHFIGLQSHQGQDELIREIKKGEVTPLVRTEAAVEPYSHDLTESTNEVIFAFPPLLSEEDFSYIALLVLFFAELDIQIEFQACFVRYDDDDEVENAKTPPALFTHSSQDHIQSTPNTKCVAKSQNNISNERPQCNPIKPLFPDPSTNLVSETHCFVSQFSTINATTDKNKCTTNRAQTAETFSPIDSLQNLSTLSAKTNRNHEGSHSSIVHGDPVQWMPREIQGREFTLTLSMPSNFPQSLGWEILESAWSTVATMLGGSAFSYKRKLWKK
ncbi:unnamed protein product [Phytomonas sp. Hart1]|nr:unnamed protein product [Phytomonas sp. Hart1]|eukprot:CCW66403.1 unnamed protein product [Phytomonas sp. isolate Hart1]